MLIASVLATSTIPGLIWSLLDSGDRFQISYPGRDAFGPTSYPGGWQAGLGVEPIPAPGAMLLGGIGVGVVAGF